MYKQAYRALGLMLCILTISACGGGGGSSSDNESPGGTPAPGGGGMTPTPQPPAEFDFQALFSSVADNVIIPGYQNAEVQAQAQVDALSTYCSAIGTETEATALSQAQMAWSDAMTVWQRTEVFQIGLVTNSGGLLRNRVHAYGATPGFNTCLIDRTVIDAEEAGFNISSRISDTRGLSAVEYLLFADTLDHTCPTGDALDQSWNTRSESERQDARCNYAQIVAADVLDAVTTLEDAWTSGTQRANLVNGDSEQVLQALSDAIFYIELQTKDIKLGVATGIKGEGTGRDFCAENACPDRVESPFSNNSFQNIRANLEAFRDMYNGGNGVGFDDLIADLDMASINQGFNAEIEAALQLVNTLIAQNENLLTQTQAILADGSNALATECTNLTTNPDSSFETMIRACRLHGLVDRITDRLRTDFVTAVQVNLPTTAAGDAD